MSRSAGATRPIALVIALALVGSGCASIQRVSGEFGPSGPVTVGHPDITDDGAVVVFSSDRAYDATDANGLSDIIVVDRHAEQTYRISESIHGGAPAGTSVDPALSGNGRYVVWQSAAPDIVAGDTNGASDIFRADLWFGGVERVSLTSTGGQSNGPSQGASISDDGRYVAFASRATNMVPGDTTNNWDVFVRDTVAGTTTQWSTDAAGGQRVQDSDQPAISGDGTKVAFRSSASFVAGDTNDEPDIYLKDGSGAIEEVSVGELGPLGSRQPAIDADGSVVAFASEASFLPEDANAMTDVYVRDLAAGTTTLASRGPGGEVGSRASVEPSLDASGTLVSFASSAPEITGSGFVRQVVVRDLAAGRTDVVSTALLGETASAAANPGVISGDGRSVAFYSAAGNLVDGDTNGVADVFVKSYPQPEVHTATPSVLGPGTTTVLVNGARFAGPTDVLLLDAPPGMAVGAVTVLGPDKLEVDITVTREVPEGTSPGLVVRNQGLFPGDLGASGVCSGCLVVG